MNFNTIRQQWKSLDAEERDRFLHSAAVTMFESKSALLLSATTASNATWNAGQSIAVGTLGRMALLRPHAIWLLTTIATVGLFFTELHWMLAVIMACVTLFLGAKISVNQTRNGIVSAAWVDLDAFSALWDMGLIAIQLQPSGRVFAKPAANTRWQDVILLALGWDENIVDIPLSRDYALDEVLNAMSAAKAK